MQRNLDSIASIKALVGQPATVSEPLMLTQSMINQFADTTQDWQWIHVDTDRAAGESPYGTTIAHGLLTLALIPAWFHRCFSISNQRLSLNYGFDKVRFLAPVPHGSNLIGGFQLARAEDVGPDEVRCVWQVEVRIGGADKLVMVATWLTQLRY